MSEGLPLTIDGPVELPVESHSSAEAIAPTAGEVQASIKRASGMDVMVSVTPDSIILRGRLQGHGRMPQITNAVRGFRERLGGREIINEIVVI